MAVVLIQDPLNDMLDFAITDDLDIKIVNGEISTQVNDETTIINAFFTDIRVDGRRGYWYDLISSELWLYEQSRLTYNAENNLNQSARTIASELEDLGMFSRVSVDTERSGDTFSLTVRCYDDLDKLVVERDFRI